MSNRGLSSRLKPSPEECADAVSVERTLSFFEVGLTGNTRQRVSLKQPSLEAVVVIDLAPVRNIGSQIGPELLFRRDLLTLSDSLYLRDHIGLHLLE